MPSTVQATLTRMVNAGDGVLFYQLTRKRVKNLNLRVERDGSVRVSAPARVSLDYVDRFVTSRADFIRAAQSRMLAEKNRVETMPDAPEELCRAKFQDALDRMAPLLAEYGIPTPTLRLRTMKSRWGSCAWGKASITLNRRLYFAPQECLDYVALHELCHLVYHDHSPRFHALLDRLMPDWKARKRKLENWNTGQ